MTSSTAPPYRRRGRTHDVLPRTNRSLYYRRTRGGITVDASPPYASSFVTRSSWSMTTSRGEDEDEGAGMPPFAGPDITAEDVPACALLLPQMEWAGRGRDSRLGEPMLCAGHPRWNARRRSSRGVRARAARIRACAGRIRARPARSGVHAARIAGWPVTSNIIRPVYGWLGPPTRGRHSRRYIFSSCPGHI
jgi:hypothetical protein